MKTEEELWALEVIARMKRRQLVKRRQNIIAKSDPEQRRLIDEWEANWKSQDQVQCVYCEKYFHPSECETDHDAPLFDQLFPGEGCSARHNIDNVCIACISCNRSKGTLVGWQFRMKLIGEWPTDQEKFNQMWHEAFPSMKMHELQKKTRQMLWEKDCKIQKLEQENQRLRDHFGLCDYEYEIAMGR